MTKNLPILAIFDPKICIWNPKFLSAAKVKNLPVSDKSANMATLQPKLCHFCCFCKRIDAFGNFYNWSYFWLRLSGNSQYSNSASLPMGDDPILGFNLPRIPEFFGDREFCKESQRTLKPKLRNVGICLEIMLLPLFPPNVKANLVKTTKMG